MCWPPVHFITTREVADELLSGDLESRQLHPLIWSRAARDVCTSVRLGLVLELNKYHVPPATRSARASGNTPTTSRLKDYIDCRHEWRAVSEIRVGSQPHKQGHTCTQKRTWSQGGEHSSCPWSCSTEHWMLNRHVSSDTVSFKIGTVWHSFCTQRLQAALTSSGCAVAMAKAVAQRTSVLQSVSLGGSGETVIATMRQQCITWLLATTVSDSHHTIVSKVCLVTKIESPVHLFLRFTEFPDTQPQRAAS